jgi:hypothetical protein
MYQNIYRYLVDCINWSTRGITDLCLPNRWWESIAYVVIFILLPLLLSF